MNVAKITLPDGEVVTAHNVTFDIGYEKAEEMRAALVHFARALGLDAARNRKRAPWGTWTDTEQ